MTCQHCQTWVGEDDHRCPRCGRRVRTVPNRISPSTYPIAAAATAYAYDHEPEDWASADPRAAAAPAPTERQPNFVETTGQQVLFSQPVNSPRVISFDAYLAGQNGVADQRPAPVQTGKVELRRPKAAKRPPRSNRQTTLDFQAEAASAPEPAIICDAAVARCPERLRAAAIDGLWMAAGSAVVLFAFSLAGGRVSLDKHALPYLLAALVTVPLFYKAFWAIANAETPGMRFAGLRLVDFDGNPPAAERRCYRAAGSLLSVLAAGMGLLWSLVDEDALTWHDHISSTFPTPSS